MPAVKYNYQGIQVSFEGNQLRIQNKNLFLNTSEYVCLVTLEREEFFFPARLWRRR